MSRHDLRFMHETHQRPVAGCEFCHREFGPPPYRPTSEQDVVKGEHGGCHCLCRVNHPDEEGICTGDAETGMLFDSPLTGNIIVKMCASCSAAIYANAKAIKLDKFERYVRTHGVSCSDINCDHAHCGVIRTMRRQLDGLER